MFARISGFFAIGLTLSAVPIHAFDISATAPKVHFNGIGNSKFPALQSYFEKKMNDEVKSAFDSTLGQARRQLNGFGSQKDLAQGMANANAYSANSATLQGYPNYDLFAVSSGFMMAAQLPSVDPGSIGDIADDISDKGDIYAGLAASYSYLNLGLNCKFLMPGLYLNVKYGGLSQSVSDFSLDYMVLGIGASYKLMEPKSLAGVIKWRGVSVGTGFYMQMDKLTLKVKVDTFATDAHFREAVLSGASSPQDSADKEAILTEMGYGKGSPDAHVLINPAFKMGLDVSTYTIPFEANTAVALLWGLVNLNFGVGMDLNFGNAKIVLEGASDANIKGNSDKVTFDKATVTVDGSSENGPSLARLRAMTGIGLGLGPVKIDVPILYYLNSGFAFGVTGAVVW